MTRKVRIATRQSQLALWQAEHVQSLLQQARPDWQVVLCGMTTMGDQRLDSPLAKIGGKGLFVKELEQAMLRDEADLAVHSMKDVPSVQPEGLLISAILARHNPLDAFVSNHYERLEALPAGAIVGTSSLRRQCQVLAARPDLEVRFLRGNVNTRLGRLDSGDYDAIILAAAGLERLGMAERIRTCLSVARSLPAVGQGAVGVECRAADAELIEVLSGLICPQTRLRVEAERALNARLNGGCQVPIAGYADYELIDGQAELYLRALVGSVDGRQLLCAEKRAPATIEDARALGTQVAEMLLSQGAGAVLAAAGIEVS